MAIEVEQVHTCNQWSLLPPPAIYLWPSFKLDFVADPSRDYALFKSCGMGNPEIFHLSAMREKVEQKLAMHWPVLGLAQGE